jgi:hypothetical protein
MTPIRAGLLVFCATILIGIALIRTQLPKISEPALPTPAPAAQPAAAQAQVTAIQTDTPKTSTAVKPRARKTTLIAKATTARIPKPAPVPGSDAKKLPGEIVHSGVYPTGAIFSGADPTDPRIQHFAD